MNVGDLAFGGAAAPEAVPGALHVDLSGAHSRALMGAFQELREQEELIDCVLAVGGGGRELVPLHAAVAAACSPMLRSTLRWDVGTVVWRGQQLRRMTVPASAAVVRALVGFMYTGVLHLYDVEDVAELWSAAAYL